MSMPVRASRSEQSNTRRFAAMAASAGPASAQLAALRSSLDGSPQQQRLRTLQARMQQGAPVVQRARIINDHKEGFRYTRKGDDEADIVDTIALSRPLLDGVLLELSRQKKR